MMQHGLSSFKEAFSQTLENNVYTTTGMKGETLSIYVLGWRFASPLNGTSAKSKCRSLSWGTAGGAQSQAISPGRPH